MKRSLFRSGLTGLFWGLALPLLAQSLLKPIAPNFAPDPQVYTGVAQETPTLSSSLEFRASERRSISVCPINLSPTPNHTLTIVKPMPALSVRVFAPSPILLTVRGKEGITCISGVNPQVMGAWQEGRYQIWISSLSGEPVTYRLSLSETSQPAAPAKKSNER